MRPVAATEVVKPLQFVAPLRANGSWKAAFSILLLDCATTFCVFGCERCQKPAGGKAAILVGASSSQETPAPIPSPQARPSSSQQGDDQASRPDHPSLDEMLPTWGWRKRCDETEQCFEHDRCAGYLDTECTQANPGSCREAPPCLYEGRCAFEGGRCVLESGAAACTGAAVCEVSGQCTNSGGACRATRREDCERTTFCGQMGRCSPVNGRCLPATERDCAQSDYCSTMGRCHVVGAKCVARSPADCEHPCSLSGLCSFENGECVAKDDKSCQRSKQCKELGLCEAKGGKCRDSADAPLEAAALGSSFDPKQLVWATAMGPPTASREAAMAFCAAFRGGGWRLPTRNELASLVVNKNAPAPYRKEFTYLSSMDGWVYSGDDVGAPNSGDPWVMALRNGHLFNGAGYLARPWCVKGR